MSLEDIRREHAAALQSYFGTEASSLSDAQIALWASRHRRAVAGEPRAQLHIDRDQANTFKLRG